MTTINRFTEAAAKVVHQGRVLAHILVAGLIVLALSSFSAAQSPISGQAVPSLAQLDTIMQAEMAQYTSPGATLAVTVNGKLVFARGYGYANTTTGELVQPDSLFRIASNSKPITAAGIYKLIEQGKLSLTTQPFATILNTLTPPPGTTVDPRYAQITIQDLLQHTAGFDDSSASYPPDPAFANAVIAATTFGANPPATPQLLIQYMLGQPLQHNPGTTYAYSNLGYIILGYIIEQVSGTPYATFIQNNVFSAAGIVRTQAGNDLLSGQLTDEVTYYDYPGAPLVQSVETTVVPTLVPYPYGGYSCTLNHANGCWVSSTMDLLRFTDSINGQFATNILTTPVPPFLTPQVYAAVPETGAGWDYIFYGSLPGTNSLVHMLTGSTTTGKVTYSAIFNTRNGGTLFGGNIEQPETDTDNAILAFVQTVTSWPTGDLFPIYAGSTSACSFTLSTLTQNNVPTAGSSLTMSVTDANFCAWSAVSNATWLHVTSGALNSDSGSVAYTVDANTGAPRSGTISIAGQTLTVNQNGTATPTTLVLSTSTASAKVGQSVTLTATLSPFGGGSTNGETVTFSSGSTSLGSAPLTNGVATLTTTSLPAGTDSVTASYPGDATYAASTAASAQVVMSQASTTLALTAAPTAATTGQSVTLTATLTPFSAGTNTTTGETVTFSSGSTTLGTAALAGGVATLATTSLPTGTDSVTATYAGDTNFTGSTSPAVQVVVTAAKVPTALALTAAPTSATTGQSVTLTATLAPFSSGTNTTNGETVTFSNGSTVLGTGTLASGVATLATTALPAGTNTITASYAGDTNFTASTAASVQVVVSAPKTTTTITLTATPSSSTYGQAVTLTATLSPFSAGSSTTNGESVSFSNGSTALGTGTLASGVATLTTSTLPAGSNSITASYAGDANFAASSSGVSVTVGKATATITLGNLTVTYNGSAQAATATTSPAGLAVGLTYGGSATAPTNAGSYAVVATITDPNYTGTANGTLVIAKAAATVTLSGLSASYNGSPHAATVTTVPSGLSVSVTYNGSATAPTAAGSYAVVATVTDPNYTGSASGTLVIAVPLIASSTALTTSAASVAAGANVTFTATVTGAGTPTGTVTFLNGTTSLGTGTLNGSGVATLTTSFSTAGSYSITAQYGGDATFSGSTSAAVSETVVPVGISASVSPNPLTIKSGSSGTLTITLTPTGGYTGTVTFTCGTLPTNASCTFAPTSVVITSSTTTATDTLTVNTTTATKAAMLSAPVLFGRRSAALLAVTLSLPGPLVVLLGFKRRKALHRLLILAVFCLAILGLGALSGCGGSGNSTTVKPGSYSVPVVLSLTGGSSQTVNATIIIQ